MPGGTVDHQTDQSSNWIPNITKAILTDLDIGLHDNHDFVAVYLVVPLDYNGSALSRLHCPIDPRNQSRTSGR
jgi:hypothetical protein